MKLENIIEKFPNITLKDLSQLVANTRADERHVEWKILMAQLMEKEDRTLACLEKISSMLSEKGKKKGKTVIKK